MTDLNQLVFSFSKEEQQQFINYLSKKNKRKDTKNIELFKLLQQTEDTKIICNTLYKKQNKAAYHALRKRLYQSVIDFIANKNLDEENSIDMQLIKLLIVARACLSKKQFKTAYHLLDKATIIAEDHALFSILNEIYHTKIQYSYTYPKVDLDSLISAFKTNQKNTYLESQLNMVYAKIRQQLNAYAYNGEIFDFEKLIDKTLKDHDITLENAVTFKALYQIMSIVSLSAFVTNDYYKIESFLLKTYDKIKHHKNKIKQPYYHIQVLYMIANTLFRNKKFEAASQFLLKMKNQLTDHKKKYYNTFILKHNLLKSLIFNFTNQQDDAIILLEKSTKIKHDDIESSLDIHLSLAMFYIQNQNLKASKKITSKFYHTDSYYESKAGKDWIIKKNLLDIILNIELGNINLVESRILSFKRNYSTYLKQISQQRVLTFLKLVETYYKQPESVSTKNFKETVEQSFKWIEPEREDIFVMSFYAWLKSKMEKQDLYTTTLNLVELAKPVN